MHVIQRVTVKSVDPHKPNLNSSQCGYTPLRKQSALIKYSVSPPIRKSKANTSMQLDSYQIANPISLFNKYSPSPPLHRLSKNHLRTRILDKSASPDAETRDLRSILYKPQERSLFAAYTSNLNESGGNSPSSGFYKRLRSQCSCLLQIRYIFMQKRFWRPRLLNYFETDKQTVFCEVYGPKCTP